MKALIKKIANKFFLEKKSAENIPLSYSQGNEDHYISQLFNEEYKGHYIDIGAHHPTRLNNTYLFYQKGWRGILLEPNSQLFESLIEARERDLVLPYAAGNFSGKANFYYGEHDVHSSLINHGANTNQGSYEVDVRPLKEVLLEQKWPKIFDYISLDTEGTEVDVLEGLDLNHFRPQIILAEYNTAGHANKKLQEYLIQYGYQVIFISQWNFIFSNNFEKDILQLYRAIDFNKRF